MKPISVEGYSPREILNLPRELLDATALTGEPLALRVGSAEVLGCFAVCESRLVIELAHIEGGEGVLRTLWLLAQSLAEQRGLQDIEWIVHAVHCARPNPKLRATLERRGFEIRDLSGRGTAFYLLHGVHDSHTDLPNDSMPSNA